MNNYFCLALWFSMYIGKKFVKPCCLWSVKDKRYSWETVDDIEKILNSPEMQKMRENALKGIIPEPCKSNCLKRIRPRKILMDYWLGDSFKKERLVPKPPLKPLQVDFQFGSKCNLQCRSCGSWGSCNWYEDDKSLQKLNPNFKRMLIPEYKLDISKFKDSKELFSDILRFDFKGGEPMLQDGMVEMIENLIRWEKAPDIILAQVTNGSYINQEAVKRWKDFKEIRVILSLDGTEELFSYIRGYDFKKFEENLYKYDEIENLRGFVNITVSIYNILDLAEINHWFLTRNCKRFPSAKSPAQHFDSNVTNPAYLDVKILPKKYKQLALKNIYKYDHPNIPQLADWLKSIQDIPPDEKQLKLFVSFTKEMDKRKGTDFLKLRPEFEDIYKEYS